MDKKPDSKVKVVNTDFGLNLSKSKHRNNQFPYITNKPPRAKAHIWKSIIVGFNIIRRSIINFFKFSFKKFGRTKWKISRSIFLGRGVYFKYVSNLTILLILAVGLFIYTGTIENREDDSGFLSKFVTNTQASQGVLTSSATETILFKKSEPIRYSVKAEDTLSSIAEKFSSSNNKISVDTIKWANNITSDTLEVGAVLEFPPMNGVLHTVDANESLLDIAAKYGKTADKSDIEIQGVLQEITDVNLLNLRNEGDKKVPIVVEGQKIIIPGGVIAPIVTQPQTVAQNPIQQPEVQIIEQGPIFTEPVGSGGYGWPVAGGGGYVSQYYSGGHTALDIADGTSPLLVAVADGTIKQSGWSDPLCAYNVWVVHDDGSEAWYCHLVQDSMLVQAGQRVVRGQALGTMGMTGLATGIHVHFQFMSGGVWQDPMGYISR